MKRINNILVFFLLPMIIPILTLAQDDNWKVAKDKDGIKVQTRLTEHSEIKEFFGECLIEGDYSLICAILLDFKDYPSWVSDCEEVSIIREEEVTVTYHAIFSVPWPFQDRDVVTTATIRQTADTLVITEKEAEGILGQSDDFVRMPEYETETKAIRAGEGKVYYSTRGLVDPGGALPGWLVNSFVADGPYKAMTKLRKLAEKD